MSCKMRKLALTINGLTVQEAKEIMVKVREIEQRHPQDLILATVKGLEDLSVEEATNILKEIFPVVKK